MDCEIGSEIFTLMNKFRLLHQKYKYFGELSQAEFCMLFTIGVTVKERRMEDETVMGITTTEIVKILGTSLSAASKQLRSIEEKGYIERIAHPKDRRITYILLSEKGNAVLSQQKEKRDQLGASIIKKMGKERVLQLRNLMEQIYEIMKEELLK